MENDLNILQLHETFTVLLPIFLEIWDIILFLLAYIQEQEELMKKKYGGLVKKKPPLITKDHERAFFDSADWALGKQGGHKAKTPAEALRPKLEPTPHQQLRTRLSASKLTDTGEDGSNNDLDQLDDEQSGIPAADGENKS